MKILKTHKCVFQKNVFLSRDKKWIFFYHCCAMGCDEASRIRIVARCARKIFSVSKKIVLRGQLCCNLLAVKNLFLIVNLRSTSLKKVFSKTRKLLSRRMQDFFTSEKKSFMRANQIFSKFWFLTIFFAKIIVKAIFIFLLKTKKLKIAEKSSIFLVFGFSQRCPPGTQKPSKTGQNP